MGGLVSAMSNTTWFSSTASASDRGDLGVRKLLVSTELWTSCLVVSATVASPRKQEEKIGSPTPPDFSDLSSSLAAMPAASKPEAAKSMNGSSRAASLQSVSTSIADTSGTSGMASGSLFAIFCWLAGIGDTSGVVAAVEARLLTPSGPSISKCAATVGVSQSCSEHFSAVAGLRHACASGCKISSDGSLLEEEPAAAAGRAPASSSEA
mmetsp:Transcript_42539/g.77673  ORF Transcript_42539/g.77673 Transcript_42539/m.77673 type:complete len:209 (+) Transcript_42539:633-1259(+)